MTKSATLDQTIPQPVLTDGTVGLRPILKASTRAAKAWEKRQAEAEALAATLERERQASERVSVERHLSDSERLAEGRGEPVERNADGAIETARDGLRWLYRKGKVQQVHYLAGLRFRSDYERANGSAVKSSLTDQPRSNGMIGSGPTDAMMRARDEVKAALRALVSPMLEVYAVEIAGEGRMLTDPRICGQDARRSADHLLPCVIALDHLARHYRLVA